MTFTSAEIGDLSFRVYLMLTYLALKHSADINKVMKHVDQFHTDYFLLAHVFFVYNLVLMNVHAYYFFFN